jgi:molybdopterin converting factor small subunit
MLAATITIHVPSPLRAYCGGARTLSLPATSVRSLLDQLEQRQPDLHRNIRDETGAVRRHVNLFVNKDNVRDLAGLDTVLTEGDVLTIMPAVSGG